MKKLSFLVIVAICLSFSKKTVTNNKTQPDCYDPLIEEFVVGADSLSSFFLQAKSALLKKEWGQFTNSMKQGRYQDALALCGNFKPMLEDKLVSAYNRCASSATKLYQGIDSKRAMSEQQRKTIILSKSNCYMESLADNNFMPVKSILAKRGYDCGTDYSRCKRVAKKSYVSQLWGCFFDGLGVSVVSGPLGLGVGVGCVATAWLSYDEEMSECLTTYTECLRR